MWWWSCVRGLVNSYVRRFVCSWISYVRDGGLDGLGVGAPTRSSQQWCG